MQPKISIIIPVYNVERYIRECLDSILQQSYTEIEVIAVDDCGDDGSMSIVEEYAQNDHRVVVVPQETNMGPMVAREVGYNKAKGDYIFFCDSDDTLTKNALELLYKEAIKSNADIVIGNMSSIEMDGSVRLWKKEQLIHGTDRISVYKSLFEGGISHNLCAKLFKKKLLTDYTYTTIPNMRNGEDAMLFYQIVDNCEKVVCIDEPIYNYIQHMSSSSHIRVSNENIEKIILCRCFQYNNIVKKYHEIEHLGYSATIRGISSLWYRYPYYSSRRLVDLLRKNNISQLFTINQVYKRLGIKGVFSTYFVASMKYIYNKFIIQIVSQ